MDEMLQLYVGDFKEQLISCSEALIDIKNGVEGNEVYNTIFRVVHTIKGNSASMSFSKLETLTHKMEDILHYIRDKRVKINEPIIDAIYSLYDFLEDSLNIIEATGSDETLDISERLLMVEELKKNVLFQDKDSDEIINFKIPIKNSEDVSLLISKSLEGQGLYRIKTELEDDCQMKSVRNWLIFNCIDTLGEYIFSSPPRPSAEEFQEINILINENIMEIYFVSDKRIDLLKKEINEISELKGMKINELKIDWIKNQKDIIEIEKIFINQLNDIIKELSNIKKENKKEKLDGIKVNLKDLIRFGEKAVDKFLYYAICKINEKIYELDIDEIFSLLNKTKEAIEDHNLISDSKFKNEFDLILKRDLIIEESQEQKKKENKQEKIDISVESAFIKLPVSKVVNLMDMLGELLILNAQMEQNVSEMENIDDSFANIVIKSSKLIRGIQGISMSLRLVEIKSTLHKLFRIARDTAKELSKKVEINIEGEEVEIDRSAQEKLYAPLMHLVRNAVSHGIEDEKERIKMGKTPFGNILIRVYSKRGNVYIEVSDDGRGIDAEKIYNKAQKLGIINNVKEYTEDEVLKLIFSPGFSTQEEVNNIAGRGVGMNVVESELKKLGGKIDIQNRVGRGVTFSLRIPMNLAVINGTIVEISGGKYIIPTLFIKEFFTPTKENWVSMQGTNKAIKLRDYIIPVINSRDIFGEKYSLDSYEDKVIIVFELENKLLAIPVDKIVGRQEVVSKPLEKEFSCIGFASSASILGDGKVSIILDVESMFNLKLNE